MATQFYSFDECTIRKPVISALDKLKHDGKIFYDFVEKNIMRINIANMTKKEIANLKTLFDDNDIIEDKDCEYEDLINDYDDEEDVDIFGEDF